MTLYEINEQLTDLLENQFDDTCLDLETGEINEALFASKISDLSLDIDTKMENIACYIKNLVAETAAIKAEQAALAKRSKAKENKVQSLESYLSGFMELTGRKKFESARCALSFRKSESVCVEDEKLVRLDERFLKYSEPSIDKMAIKKLLKVGQEVPGASLRINANLQIK